LKTFELFHLNLQPRESLFAPHLTREQWLRNAFSRSFEFAHRNKTFHWVPAELDVPEIIGTVARQHLKLHHLTPDEGAAETLSEEWQGAIVVIDPTSHDDGQKLAFEIDATIGRTEAVLASLAAHINETRDAAYDIEPKAIWTEREFWAWAVAHSNLVKKITFDFAVPNMWNSASNLEEELRELGAETGAIKAKVGLESPDGVKTDSQQVTDAVQYSAQGAGDITAVAINGDKFRSHKSRKMSKLLAMPADGIEGLSKWVQKILGREQLDSLDGDSGPTDGVADS
jgi:hypothetical protein